MRFWIISICLPLFVVTPVAADRAAYVHLARLGWNYELRTTMIGRDMSIPIHIHGRDLAGASLCIVGEQPHPHSLATINAFRDLSEHVFGKPLTMRHAGNDASSCGSGRTVVLRLYSGHPPNRALSSDLSWMNQTYELGLPERRQYAVSSPAMAQTFFGRRGQGTHIMVKQPARTRPGMLEAAFYKSILVEELFQSFTFGMDILLFDPNTGFQSKLQETPLRMDRLSWESSDFMRAMLRSNPAGLCAFDVFMMHAVAQTSVDQTVDPLFIEFIDREYEVLLAQAELTMADDRFAAVLAPGCQRSPI
ncbi:hypothetical protein [Roseobacter litoralis]|uniref:Uncharacterized protein n=1 Tax=Roseobacter litoralis (strain ATCC 49566 / DSM 6996 / JCM 21268 / NBRC 15278 / OCh 149) TaxID=391595 RepID=F7ZCC9_ROSLO|nr:hypothetical protein [Roseobacter litoralis]AEI95702.1 hypothetical protein RLO149_c037890 [Roseobacter litoralis Och 149]